MKKIYFLVVALFVAVTINAQTILYSNNFEVNGVGDATIVGNGRVVASQSPGFGNVFHNAFGGQAIRANYLLLPGDIFTRLQESGKRTLTIAFWVNRGTATGYHWSPIFSAYGAAPVNNQNTWPMMILQSRLIAQVNCFGWSDFTNTENVAGINTISTSWLDDGNWHYYTATFTDTSARIYINGVLQNSWTFAGGVGNSITGIFTNGSSLTYIALGGNQAWNWGDVDPAFMYDDLVIYSDALTVEQINANISIKRNQTSVNETSFNNNAQLVEVVYYSITGSKVGSDFNALSPGVYIMRSVYNNGEVKSTKVIKNR